MAGLGLGWVPGQGDVNHWVHLAPPWSWEELQPVAWAGALGRQGGNSLMWHLWHRLPWSGLSVLVSPHFALTESPGLRLVPMALCPVACPCPVTAPSELPLLSPRQPWFYGWGFNLPRGQALLEKWNLIPEGVDILITHGPPLGKSCGLRLGWPSSPAGLGWRFGAGPGAVN